MKIKTTLAAAGFALLATTLMQPAFAASTARQAGTAATATEPASSMSAESAAPMASNSAPVASSASEANDSTAREGTEKMMLTKQQTVDVQHALISRGFAIKADGIWGPNSTKAMKDFQGKNGLSPTGYVDEESLTALQITKIETE